MPRLLPTWAGAGGFLLAAWLPLGFVSAGERTAIGERIIFSGGDDARLPEPRPVERHRPFEFLERGNSVGGVTDPIFAPLPGSVPNLQRNPRLWEMLEQKLEQKKNWIYNRPEDMNRQPTLEQMFGVRESEAVGGKMSRRGRDTAFERDENPKDKPLLRRKERSSDDLNDRESANPVRLTVEFGRLHTNDGPRAAGLFEPHRVVGAGFGGPDGLFNTASSPGRMADFTSHEAILGRKRVDPKQGASDPFGIVLTPPSAANPLALGFDPINLRVDTTRQELNPVIPTGLNQSLPGSSLGSLDALRTVAGPPSRSSLSLVEDRNTQVLGPSSLSPAVAAPAESRFSPPPPTVLEFPKRKF